MKVSTARSYFREDGGHVALDFVNTLDWRDRAQPEDRLAAWTDVLGWARRMRLVGAREAKALATEAGRAPAAAMALFREAVRLREAMSRIFRASLSHAPAEARDLALLNARLRRLPQTREVAADGAHYVWKAAAARAAPARLIDALALAAAALMTSPEFSHLRLCAAAGCGWLFLDASPNRSRRWCAMASCGNRAKAERHYARKRKAATSI